MVEQGLKEGDCPRKDFPSRIGDMRQDVCIERYKKKTVHGKTLPTETDLHDINIQRDSVTKPPLLIKYPNKQSGEPLYQSAGIINYFLANVSANIREWETDRSFMIETIKNREGSEDDGISIDYHNSKWGNISYLQVNPCTHPQ